jgi:hypothetical protein
VRISQLINGYDAMIGRRQGAIGQLSGFPAGSLPRLQFLPDVVLKSMIERDFSVRRELGKIFYPEFSRAAGNRERCYPLPVSSSLASR